MKNNVYAYPGNELELFADAVNWKRYFSSLLKPFISGDVLEAGAGKGVNTAYLLNGQVSSWTLLEPDDNMASCIGRQISESALPPFCQYIHGTIQSIPEEKTYDCIMYIDVLEHIENDRQELIEATKRLKPGGRLLILAPAHQQLMSPFDRAIGHYRRYNRKSLRAAMPGKLMELQLFYADSLGLLASMANRYILGQAMPGKKQIRFWDGMLIPLSRVIDKILFHRAGKTVIGIWKKPME